MSRFALTLLLVALGASPLAAQERGRTIVEGSVSLAPAWTSNGPLHSGHNVAWTGALYFQLDRAVAVGVTAFTAPTITGETVCLVSVNDEPCGSPPSVAYGGLLSEVRFELPGWAAPTVRLGAGYVEASDARGNSGNGVAMRAAASAVPLRIGRVGLGLQAQGLLVPRIAGARMTALGGGVYVQVK